MARRRKDVIHNGVTLILGRVGEQLELARRRSTISRAPLGVFAGQLGDIHGYTAGFAAREQL
jgi:hypothetical protein